MEYTPQPEREDVLRMLALDDEHMDAEIIARVIKSKRYPSRLLDFLATHDQRKFRLVVDALNGKRTRQHLSDEAVRIMQAYHFTEWTCGRRSFDGKQIIIDFSKPAPTLFEIKMQYAKLFIKERPPRDPTRQRAWLRKLEEQNRIPDHKTFRRTLTRCKVDFLRERPPCA